MLTTHKPVVARHGFEIQMELKWYTKLCPLVSRKLNKSLRCSFRRQTGDGTAIPKSQTTEQLPSSPTILLRLLVSSIPVHKSSLAFPKRGCFVANMLQSISNCPISPLLLIVKTNPSSLELSQNFFCMNDFWKSSVGCDYVTLNNTERRKETSSKANTSLLSAVNSLWLL